MKQSMCGVGGGGESVRELCLWLCHCNPYCYIQCWPTNVKCIHLYNINVKSIEFVLKYKSNTN